MKRTSAAQIAMEARNLLETEGSAAVTMRRVGGAIGISGMAVYRHFADRDALLNAVADQGFMELAGRLTGTLAGDLNARMRTVLDLNLDFALERPRMFELMFLQPRKGARKFPGDFAEGKSPTANVFGALVAEGIRNGVIRDVDVWEVVFETGALLQGLVMLYLGGRMSVNEQGFREVCHRAMGRYMDGIRS